MSETNRSRKREMNRTIKGRLMKSLCSFKNKYGGDRQAIGFRFYDKIDGEGKSDPYEFVYRALEDVYYGNGK